MTKIFRVVVQLDIAMILLLAAGVSMDAFAVSVTNGMCYKLPVMKNALYSGLAFGAFQALMPLVGYAAGHTFSGVVESWDHWLALLLLGFIGVKMIVEAIRGMKNPEAAKARVFSFKLLTVQAVATSIDALAVGISLGVMKVNLAAAISTIGATTFLFSFAGVLIGKKFGRMLKEKAELLGGIILVIIGIHIFMEHTILARTVEQGDFTIWGAFLSIAL